MLEPTIIPPSRSMEMGFPETVAAGPAGERVWPLIAIALLGSWVIVSSVSLRVSTAFAVVVAVVGGVRRGLVTPLITMADADGAREYVVDTMTSAELPGASVWLPITNSEARFAAMIEDPRVRIAAAEGAVGGV